MTLPATILVVEDDESLADLLGMLLRREGLPCVVARDTTQADALARQFRLSLVVLDWMMPAGGGGAVHRRLRQFDATRDTPILVLTAAPEEQVFRQIDMDRRTYFLAKPYHRQELIELVKEILADQ